ncbi:hypothetical protein ASE69_06305 [Sphingomonas sp. Leaf208]|nr:hypothetical protein ASE69_06305 [Sphingomonas sp. Leaf208]
MSVDPYRILQRPRQLTILPAKRPPLPPKFKILIYARSEVRTITEVYKATPRQMIADVDGVAYRFEDRIWGLLQDLIGGGMSDPQQYVGVRLVAKQHNLHQWRYGPVRAPAFSQGPVA